MLKKVYIKGRGFLTDMREVSPGQWLSEAAAKGLGAFYRSHPDLYAMPRRGGIRSAWRSMEDQTALWERYRETEPGRAARPGYSIHQSGGALDLDEPLRSRMVADGGRFGWSRPYPEKEPWHFEHSEGWQRREPAAPVRRSGGGLGWVMLAGIAALGLLAAGGQGGKRGARGR